MQISDKLSLADYMWIRRLRNANSRTMTGYQGGVGLFRQILFWLLPPAGLSVFLAYSQGQRAGYLVLRQHTAESAYITEVVAPEFRGQGVASGLIDLAKSRYPLLIADIFESNIPSIRLHTHNGFYKIGQRDSVIRYAWRK